MVPHKESHSHSDMIPRGRGGLSFEEEKTHFTAWAFMKSPLIINTDVSSLATAVAATL